MTKIFVIAGEHSGDVLGAGLMRELKTQGQVEFSGVGGPLMEAQGLESLTPMEELCVMGLWEVVGQLPRLLKLIEGMVHEIEQFKPDVVVTIDLPDFNFQVAKRLKKRGFKGKLVHYVAPSVWAWRPGRAKKIAEFLDGLICLFPHEPPYFTKHKLRAEFVGHPLIENNPLEASGAAVRESMGIPQDAPVLGLFFGSREAELNVHADILKETVQGIYEQYPDLRVIIPTLPNLEYEVMQAIHGVKYPAYVLINPDEKWDEFAACNYALAVSGTVGLELSYMGIPHVIAYKMHPVTMMAVKMLAKTKFAHLTNILLKEQVVPEFLQGRCNPYQLVPGMLRLMKDEGERQKQLSRTGELRAMLQAEPGKSPSAKAAEFVLKFAKKKSEQKAAA